MPEIKTDQIAHVHPLFHLSTHYSTSWPTISMGHKALLQYRWDEIIIIRKHIKESETLTSHTASMHHPNHWWYTSITVKIQLPVCAGLHDDVAVVCGRGPWSLGASVCELYVDGYWQGRRSANACVKVVLQHLSAFFVVHLVSKYNILRVPLKK